MLNKKILFCVDVFVSWKWKWVLTHKLTKSTEKNTLLILWWNLLYYYKKLNEKLTNLILLGKMRVSFSWGIMSSSLKGERQHHVILISSRNWQLSLILRIASWSSTTVQFFTFIPKYFNDRGKFCLKNGTNWKTTIKVLFDTRISECNLMKILIPEVI